MPPRARRQAGKLNAADFDANQLRDRVAERGHHTAHLTIAAFIDRQLKVRLSARAVRVRFAAQEAHIFGRPCHAVVEHDAPAQPLQSFFCGNAGDGNAVRFRYVVARVSHLKQKIAVVSEKDQPFAVGIQAANGAQHRLSANVYQVRYHLPGVAVRVGARGDNSLWLVQRQVVAFQRRTDNPVIKKDFVGFRVGLRAKLRDSLSINFDPALGDPRFARSPRADPGGGEHLLQSFFHTV